MKLLSTTAQEFKNATRVSNLMASAIDNLQTEARMDCDQEQGDDGRGVRGLAVQASPAIFLPSN